MKINLLHEVKTSLDNSNKPIWSVLGRISSISISSSTPSFSPTASTISEPESGRSKVTPHYTLCLPYFPSWCNPRQTRPVPLLLQHLLHNFVFHLGIRTAFKTGGSDQMVDHQDRHWHYLTITRVRHCFPCHVININLPNWGSNFTNSINSSFFPDLLIRVKVGQLRLFV